MSSNSLAVNLSRAVLSGTLADAFADGKLTPEEKKKIAADAKKASLSAGELQALLDVNLNLARARLAVQHVRSLSIAASNWKGADKQTKQCVKGVHETYRQQKGDALEQIKRAAALAEERGCGNCGEQASVAFMFLHRQGVGPINRMSLGPKKKPRDGEPGNGVDHAFVVIGRASKQTGILRDWNAWGPKAVICDPWGAGYAGDEFAAYPADQFEKMMRRIQSNFEWVRCLHREG